MQLSKELKEGTKKSHSAAENTQFVAAFLRGILDETQYRKLIANFYFIYSAMETRIDQLQDHPVVSQINLSDLKRKSSLERDLFYYYGPNWKEKVCPSLATQQYVDRILTCPPEYLVAHHYTRYLGDLSGGQILKGIAKTALNPAEGLGLEFYEFPNIDDAKLYKKCYRGILDNLPIDDSMINALVAEANYAFRLNMYMFEEFEGSAGKSLLNLIINFLKRR